MNLHDKIIATLRGGPLDFDELRTAVNNDTDPRHPWSEEWFIAQLELLQWRGSIVRDGKGVFSVKGADDLDTPPTF